ncbi:MAG: DNA-3-methyladenine glycosylase family protein [Candidatus Dormibacteraceae bacterium]
MAQLMEASVPTGTFEITPRGPYSLAAAASFAFGPERGQDEGAMRLAFAVDGGKETAAVVVHQDPSGAVHGEVWGPGDVGTVRAQVARILSLDRDGSGWAQVAQRDPVLSELQARHPGFRQVLFSSPYEAAAWSVLYGRKTLRQVRALRDRVATRYGDTYQVQGVPLAAFPAPARLLQARPEPGIAEVIVQRLHAVARFASEGRLEVERLRAMDEAVAIAELRRLPGVGEFFSELILLRAAGPMDAWRRSDRLDACIRHYYGVDPTEDGRFQEIGDRLRPYRSWAMVLLRRCGDEDGVA